MDVEGNVISAGADLLQRYDTLFGISKNVARAIPNIRDGLKPVQRKILFTMNEMGRPDDAKKVGSIVGEVLKIYSHGDVSVTDALVRMATTWGNIAPCIIGIGNYGCGDENTMVLTRDGWKYFRDVTENDELASVDPVSKVMIFEKPTELIKAEYHGDLIYGQHDSLDFAVTPNHRMLIKRFEKHNGVVTPNPYFEFVRADEIPNYSNLMTEFYTNNPYVENMVFPETTLRHGEVLPEKNVKMDAWVEFLGIYLADGTANKDGNGCGFVISGKKDRKVKFFSRVLTDLGVKYRHDGRAFYFSDKQMYDKFLEYDLIGKHAPDKFVPDFVFNLSKTQIEKFLNAFAMGDGQFMPFNAIAYHTTSKRLAEQIQILLLMCGKFNKIYNRAPRRYEIEDRSGMSRECYTVYQWGGKHLSMSKSVHVFTDHYDGYVYCADMPTYHTLIFKRNECVMVTGNSVMGTEHAAERYIEAKLSPFARQCFFTDKLCIDMVPTYDNTRLEPETLPSMFPMAIINGATGSGFGASCNIPQYNLKDVIETTIKLIDNPQAKIKLIPDSHWGCDIMSSKPFGKYKTSFDQIFETGYGSYIQRFRYQIDHEKNIVIVTALPAKVKLEDVLKEIERLQNENKAFPELKSMADLSGKDHDDGIWVEFKLFEGKNPYRFISKLETVKDMKKTVKVNIDLVDGLEVNHYSIRSYITSWYQYRHDYIRACISTELTTVDSDIAINDIKLFIFDEDRLEKTTDIYVSSVDTNDIIKKLMNEYSASTGMTSQQAMILAGMSGKDYTKSALKKYKELKVELKKEHDRLEKILMDPNGINDIIKQQLKSGLKFATPRGSKVIGQFDSMEDEKFVLAIQPANGTIVKLTDNEDSQKLIEILPANLCTQIDSNDNAIIFDNMGRYMIVNPGELPLMKDLSSMVPLNRYIDKPLKNLIAMEPLDETCRSFIVITKLGKIKKINPRNYRNKVSNNCYIGLDDGDEVVSVIGVKSDNSHIIVYTDTGNAQRFHANIINVTGQTAIGSYGISVPDGEHLAGGFCISGSDLIAYITRRGYVRINNSKYFPVRKNKKDWVHLIDMKGADKLAAIVPCTANDTLHVVYNNLTSSNIAVKSIPVDTMSQPPRDIAHKAKLTVVNVKRIQKKK